MREIQTSTTHKIVEVFKFIFSKVFPTFFEVFRRLGIEVLFHYFYKTVLESQAICFKKQKKYWKLEKLIILYSMYLFILIHYSLCSFIKKQRMSACEQCCPIGYFKHVKVFMMGSQISTLLYPSSLQKSVLQCVTQSLISLQSKFMQLKFV